MSRSRANHYVSGLLVAIVGFVLALNGCKGGGGATSLVTKTDTASVTQPAIVTLNVNLVDSKGNPVNGFRWLLEEDTLYHVDPGIQKTDSQSVNIRRTYAPPVSTGHSLTSSDNILIQNNLYYFLTVLADTQGYSLGGIQIVPGQGSVTIQIHEPPVPTAQISVLVFEDNQLLNGAPDVPVEPGLAGFQIKVNDILGQEMMDAFGNPLGTTYQQNPDGSFVLNPAGKPVVNQMGHGIVSDASGSALIKNLPHGDFFVYAIPPAGQNWVQTSTIEGTMFFEAWVKSNEPAFMNEWGAPSVHTFFGFAHPMLFPAPTGTVGSITGQAVYLHDYPPPLVPGQYTGGPIPTAWVALNDLLAADNLVYNQPCDNMGNFQINNVPPGTYNMVIYDQALDAIIDFRTVIVPDTGGSIALGQVGVAGWYGTLQGNIFEDANANGFYDTGEKGIDGDTVNIRFPEGNIYQSTVTDPTGYYNFVEVFPFFHWMVTEVDNANYKSTGATATVDAGGPVAPGAVLNPQIQPGGLPYRTQLGSVLTQDMILYSEQTNEIDWGKAPYGLGQNGGINGIVSYDTTRAEDDPRWGTQELWQAGIPRVQVNLYQSDGDGNIIDVNGDTLITLADVDNYPFGWQTGGAKGIEDVDRNSNGTFDAGDAIQITHTFSWDDNNPTGCPGPAQTVYGSPIKDCAETLITWDQVRPGSYDGKYSFSSYHPGGISSGSPDTPGIPSGYYIAEVDAPPVYEVVKSQDRNIYNGEAFYPNGILIDLANQAIPVGDPYVVPPMLSLFNDIPSPLAGQTLRMPDRKQTFLHQGKNAVVNFFLFTSVPIAGHLWGMVFNDIAMEFDPSNPNYGNNLGVGWLPIAIRDFMGNQITRIYTDEWGKYDGMVPGTYTINPPAPSGVAPAAYDICLNDPGPIPDPAHPGQTMIDPWFNPTYGQICTGMTFLPGLTQDPDTPILPIGAFSQNKLPLNCEFPDGVPVIASVTSADGGPYVSTTPESITITSRGSQTVYNPDYDPSVPLSPQTVVRDYGFGAVAGTVTIGGVPLTGVSWSASTITGNVPAGAQTGELVVTRGDNNVKSVLGITVHVAGPKYPSVVHVNAGQSIQAAIDAAPDHALIIIGPGVFKENIIMWHPVRLQGTGAYATTILASPMTMADQNAWDAKFLALFNAGNINLIGGDTPVTFLERYAGVMVNFASTTPVDSTNPPQVDGVLIMTAISGGGVFANAYASYLEISNIKFQGNQGTFGGAIRLGTPSIADVTGTTYLGSNNPGIKIHNNQLSQNGSINGAGGIAIFNGSDNYAITDNFICGNYTLAYGGGIAHFGLSNNCEISHNSVILNQSTDEGGGIMVAGELAPVPITGLTPGSGSVVLNGNYITSNLGGDDGGGIRTLMTNGQDVLDHPTDPTQWYEIDVLNNMIADNSSGDAGGGISIDDSTNIYIINNTITHNDSTATGPDAFGPCTPNVPPGQVCPPGGGGGAGATNSNPRVAGIHAGAHSSLLIAAMDPSVQQLFANPVLQDNIIYENRSFYWDAAYNAGFGGLRPDIAGGEPAVFWDLSVDGTAAPQYLSPMYSILTSLTQSAPGGGTHNYSATNLAVDPLFVDNSYFNKYLATAKFAAIGNFVMATFITPTNHGNYHIMAGSPAINHGGGVYYTDFPELTIDIDGNPRPSGGGIDSGAHQKP